MRYLYCLLLALFSFLSKAQDAVFSNPVSAPMFINPALTGDDSQGNTRICYRNQWPKIADITTLNVTIAQYFPKAKMHIGLLYQNYNPGAIQKHTGAIILSRDFLIGRNFLLRPAFQAGYFQGKLDWDKMSFGDMIDGRKGFVYASQDVKRGGYYGGIDFGAGLIMYAHQVLLGVSASHITQPNEALLTGQSPVPFKLSAQFSYDGFIVSRGNVGIKPFFIYTRYVKMNRYLAGANLVWKRRIVTGLSWRINDAIIFSGGYRSKFLDITYNYDYTVGKLKGFTGGAHEISLSIFYWDRKKPKYFINPQSVLFR